MAQSEEKKHLAALEEEAATKVEKEAEAAANGDSKPGNGSTEQDKIQSLIPQRALQLKSYTNVGNREIVAPLHEIRASFRRRGKASDAAEEHGTQSVPIQVAQKVGLDVLDSISRQLFQNAGFNEHGPGLPTSLAVHSHFIVLGTSRSFVLVFNHAQQLLRVFCKGKSFERFDDAIRHAVASNIDTGAVSSMDMVKGGMTGNVVVVVGYSKGLIELWDVTRSSLVKNIPAGPKTHTSAISFIRIVGTGGPKSNRFDASSTKKPFISAVSVDSSGVVHLLLFYKTLMMYTVDHKCLLDGSASQVLSIAENEELNMVALATRKRTFIVSLDNNTAKVVHRWPMPEDTNKPEQSAATALPRLSWSLARLTGSSAPQHVLARAFRGEVSFLKAPANASKPEINHEIHRKVFQDNTGSEIVALEWLNQNLLVILNKNYDLCILDTTSLTIVERTNIKNVELVWTSFAADQVSFQSSIRSNGSTLYLLGIKQLNVAKVQTWLQRVETLILHNGWLEALALALDHYQLTGQREGAAMSDLILRFVTSQLTLDTSESESKRWAAACIEFCLEIDRTELLFDTIYDIFAQTKRTSVILHLLEPYVLNRLLTSLRPLILQDLVALYVKDSHLRELEQVILHLTPDTIRTDLHTLVNVCKEHDLCAGLVYLYNTGLNDFETPAKLLLDMDRLEPLLTYLETTFRGLTYPFGFPMDDKVSADFSRVDLLGFLIENLRAMTRAILMEANDIKEIIGLLELGLGQHQDDWEAKAVLAIHGLDPTEAMRLYGRRLVLHKVHGLEDKELIQLVFDDQMKHSTEEHFASILRHCDPELYDVDALTERLQELSWPSAISTLHEVALAAAIEEGSNLLRITSVYKQVLCVSPKPAEFVLAQLEAHSKSIIVHQAIEDAVFQSMQLLADKVQANQQTQEKDCTEEVLYTLVRDPAKLNEFPSLQFLYLKKVMLSFIPDAESEITTPSWVSTSYHAGEKEISWIERFVDLLCTYEPTQVLKYLTDRDGLFPVDEVLEICKRHKVFDAVAFLLERTGDIPGALEVILDVLKGNQDTFQAKRSIVQAAVQMCERNEITDLDRDQAESLWFTVLDQVSDLAHTDESHESIEAKSALLRTVLDGMMKYVSAARIISKTNSSSSGQLGHTVKCMAETRAIEQSMLQTVQRIATHDLHHLVQTSHNSLARGNSVADGGPTTRICTTRRSKAKRQSQTWHQQMQALKPRPLQLD